MTKLEGMTNDQMTKRGDVVTSSFVLISSFGIRASSFRGSPKRAVSSQTYRLPARGTDAHHGEFCAGQFGDVSDIFSRGRRKLRKFACSVYGRVPARDFFVNGLAIRELSRVAWRNIQPFPE